jgi:hypothetical protein
MRGAIGRIGMILAVVQSSMLATAPAWAALPADGYETDDLPVDARPLHVGTVQSGSLHEAGDVDWKSVMLTRGVAYVVQLETMNSPSGLPDGVVEIFAADGTFLSMDDDRGPALGSKLVFRPRTSGLYLLKVRPHSGGLALFSAEGGGEESFEYRLGVLEAPNASPVLAGVHLAQTVVPPGVPLLVTADASDPDLDELWFDFDWGDGTKSFGAPSRRNHSWTDVGTYCVRVRVRDPLGASSGWSACEQVTVVAGAAGTASAVLSYCTQDYAGLQLAEVSDGGVVTNIGAIPIPDGNGEKPFAFRLYDGSPAVVVNSFAGVNGRRSTLFVRSDPYSVATIRPAPDAIPGTFESPIYARGLQLRDGRLLAVTTVLEHIDNKGRTRPANAYLDIFESRDLGNSWRRTHELRSDPADPDWAGLWQPTLAEKVNGDLILAGVEQNYHADRRCPDGRITGYRDDHVFVMRSRDGGATWGAKTRVPFVACGPSFNEPAIAELPDGRLLLVAHSAKERDLVMSIGSRDGTRWTPAQVVYDGSPDDDPRYPVFTSSGASVRLVFRIGTREEAWDQVGYTTMTYRSGTWSAAQALPNPPGLTPCKLK